MNFGGWSRFGGQSSFGGGRPWAQRYYELCKRLLLPGFWPQDDDTVANKLLRADCRGLGHGKTHVRQAFREIFPHTTSQMLAEWESMLGVVPPPAATFDERIDAVVARWRGGNPSSLPGLRAMFDPLLNPSTAFADDFTRAGTPASVLFARYDELGAGTKAIAGGIYTASLASLQHGDFSSELANLLLYRLHDLDDGWTFTVEVDAATTINASTGGGIVVFSNWDNYLLFEWSNDGALKIACAPIFEERTDAITSQADSLRKWLRVTKDKETGNLLCYWGNTLSSLTLLATVEPPFPPLRWVGIVAHNSSPWNAINIDIEQLELVHETPVNNVEICEVPEKAASASGDGATIFQGFIHRSPADSGSYDIANAQRLADRVAPGHALITVGESDRFLADDPYSLADRDICGE